MKKVIGIPGYKQQDSNGFGVGNHYLNFVSKYGNPRIIMPWEEHVEVDLVLLPGGMDLSPSSYGEAPDFTTTNQDVFKQFFYDNRLTNYVESNTPIFGICLGFQQLCAFFGSKLTQNLPYHKQSVGRFSKGHEVVCTERGAEIMGYTFKPFEVNCHHHQGVLAENLAEVLIPLAVGGNEEYDVKPIRADLKEPKQIIEAFVHNTLPIGGVQYHPEEWNDGFSSDLFEMLLNYKDTAQL